jgi:fumarate hydratase class II
MNFIDSVKLLSNSNQGVSLNNHAIEGLESQQPEMQNVIVANRQN